MEVTDWELSDEEEQQYIERFNNGEGILRGDDHDVAYFEREEKPPVRVERFRNEQGDVTDTEADWVPFVGY